MYPFHFLGNHEFYESKAKLRDSFNPAEPPANVIPMPMRSHKTSIMLALAKWREQRGMVRQAFRTIGLIAAKARHAEHRWVIQR